MSDPTWTSEVDPGIRDRYVLAMAVLQSPLWATADNEVRAAVYRALKTEDDREGEGLTPETARAAGAL